MVKSEKKENETNISLMKRFSRKMQKSGNLKKFREVQFKKRNASELNKKRSALKKEETKNKREKLYKLGKIDRFSK